MKKIKKLAQKAKKKIRSWTRDHLAIATLYGFLLLYPLIWTFSVMYGLGITELLSSFSLGEPLDPFLGNTLSRGGHLAIQLLLVWLIARLVLEEGLREIGFRLREEWRRDLLLGLSATGAVMASLFLLEAAFGWLSIEGWRWQGIDLSNWLVHLWIALLSSAVAALGEEAIFRGYLLRGLKGEWNKWSALALSSFLFSISHLSVTGAENTNFIFFALMMTLPGFMLGTLYLRTGSLWLPVGIHFGWNFFQSDLFALSGGEPGPASFGAITKMKGPQWLLGTNYGIEVGLVGVLSAFLVWGICWYWTSAQNN